MVKDDRNCIPNVSLSECAKRIGAHSVNPRYRFEGLRKKE